MKLYIGIMSGTSLDSIDAVIADFTDNNIQILSNVNLNFDDNLKEMLKQLQSPSLNEIHTSAIASNYLSEHYARAVNSLLIKANIKHTHIIAIGSHGQTIRHQPYINNIFKSYTLQIQNPSLLAHLTNIDVVANFREADIAAGGQGAPLVPAFHNYIFSYLLNTYDNAIICNIGGMSNITILNKVDNNVIGFDCGCGNVLLDAWIKHKRNFEFDEDGEWARSGHICQELIDELWKLEYFHEKAPKSTGREIFNIDYILQCIQNIGLNINPQDVQNTLTHLSAKAIANDIHKYININNEIKKNNILAICGGGAKNKYLLEILQQYLPNYKICSTSTLGIDAQHIEALAFAWLAKQYIENKPANICSVTGAKQFKILGALYKKYV